MNESKDFEDFKTKTMTKKSHENKLHLIILHFCLKKKQFIKSKILEKCNQEIISKSKDYRKRKGKL